MSAGFAKTGMNVATGTKVQPAVKGNFVGTWMLVALGGEGVLVQRLGANPTGMLIYDASGNMSVQIMNREHGRVPLNNDKDIRAAFQSYVGYFGEYSIDLEERSITHHVVGSLHPRDVGRDFKRLYQFSGGQLILTATGLIAGDPIAAHLVWTRTDP
jgi:lipocalin-like protein